MNRMFLLPAHEPDAKGYSCGAREVCSRAHQQTGGRTEGERGPGEAGGEAEESTTGEPPQYTLTSCPHQEQHILHRIVSLVICWSQSLDRFKISSLPGNGLGLIIFRGGEIGRYGENSITGLSRIWLRLKPLCLQHQMAHLQTEALVRLAQCNDFV